MIGLDELNAAGRQHFADALDGVFENAPWVAEATWDKRPFLTVTALHQALYDHLLEAGEAAQTEFLNGHPDLAGVAAQQRTMGEHSTAEQAALGLDRLDDAGSGAFAAMNRAYRERFGFPFLICVRRHTRESILREFKRRSANDPATELAAALTEVFRITRLRIAGLVQGPGMPAVGGGLSTHVLDTALGRPGAGVRVELFALEAETAELVAAGTTDAGGRVPGGLIPDGEPLRIGLYEMRFHVGAYFTAAGVPVSEPPFLDIVPLRIGLAEAEAHYHVPLLVSPWAFSTYRGS